MMFLTDAWKFPRKNDAMYPSPDKSLYIRVVDRGHTAASDCACPATLEKRDALRIRRPVIRSPPSHPIKLGDLAMAASIAGRSADGPSPARRMHNITTHKAFVPGP